MSRFVKRAKAFAKTYRGSIAKGPATFGPSGSFRTYAAWLCFVAGPPIFVLGVIAAIVMHSPLVFLGATVLSLLCTLIGVIGLRRKTKAKKRNTTTYPYGPTVGRRSSSAQGKLDASVGQSAEPVVIERREAAQTPLVTVVVAVFNDAHHLGAALFSLVKQTLPEFECIVVDDGSTDESSDIAQLFAESDRRFRVVKHDRNRGLSAARNTGLSLATAQYVTFLDSDDFLFEDSLRMRVDRVDESIGCAGSYCDWRSVPELSAYFPSHSGEPTSRDFIHLLSEPYSVPFIASAPIVRTEFIRAAGGFDETLRTAEDADMWSRLLRGGVWFGYVPYVGVAYRQRVGSMVQSAPLAHFDAVREVAARSDVAVAAWPGAPIAFEEPLSELVRENFLLPRQLNFLALHLAANGSVDVPEHLIPRRVLSAMPTYEKLVYQQAKRALTRLGLSAQQPDVDALTRQLIGLTAQPPTTKAPHVAATQLPALRGTELTSPLKKVLLSDLQVDEPVFLLVPQSRYHVDEVGPLYLELTNAGIPCHVYLPAEANVGVAREMSVYASSVVVGDVATINKIPLLGAFVLNDWGPSTSRVIAAVKEQGGVSFAKVEGVQDFDDNDTGRIRLPYRHADVVLGQGVNDKLALSDRDVVVVGSSRLERIYADAMASAEMSSVLINFNFTYGVLSEAQDMWIRSAVDACRATGRDYEISMHPAQKDIPTDSTIRDYVSVDPFSHALKRSGVLVSRFSTVIYEAMARGVPSIYFNPHGETVPTFQDPQGAFLKVEHTPLAEAIDEAMTWRGDYRIRSAEFFSSQIDVQPEPSSRRAARVIRDRIDRL